jgi:outer membrane receptor protein involved in Fe transport
VAGARYDQRVPVNPEDDPRAGVFQPTATPRAGVLIVPDEDLTVKVLYGRAFRAPNVRELLVSATETDDSGAFVFASGNLDVRPESIDTVETEVRGEPVDGLDLRGSASWSLVSREIDKVNPPNEYQNLDGRLQVVGLEAEAQYSAGPIDASAAYALTLARYGARGPYAGRAQFEFPPHMAKAALTARLGDRLSATALAELYSSRPRADWGPTVGLTDGVPYGLIHLSGRMDELGPDGRVAVGFAVRNATNTRYSTPMYRDEVDRGTADAPRFVYGIEGESRMFNVTVDVRL